MRLAYGDRVKVVRVFSELSQAASVRTGLAEVEGMLAAVRSRWTTCGWAVKLSETMMG
jgi:hypothetical protein